LPSFDNVVQGFAKFCQNYQVVQGFAKVVQLCQVLLKVVEFCQKIQFYQN
jgi:hypothetical protein